MIPLCFLLFGFWILRFAFWILLFALCLLSENDEFRQAADIYFSIIVNF